MSCARTIEAHEIVVAAHVRLADEDLRHAATASRAQRHLLPRDRIGIDSNATDIRRAAAAQVILGLVAERAMLRAIDRDGIHSSLLVSGPWRSAPGWAPLAGPVQLSRPAPRVSYRGDPAIGGWQGCKNPAARAD